MRQMNMTIDEFGLHCVSRLSSGRRSMLTSNEKSSMSIKSDVKK